MGQTISGHFDGNVIVPEIPVALPVGKRLRIHIELDLTTSEVRNKKHRLIGAGQFDSGVRDLATNKEYMEGFGES